MREKWSQEDYRRRTIDSGLSEVKDPYTPTGRASSKRNVVPPSSSDHARNTPDEHPETPDLLNLPYTDAGNAERLVRLYGADIRFCPEMKQWFVWDGRRWLSGATRQVKRLLIRTMREMYRQAADIVDQDPRASAERHARKSEAASSIRAALECAECEPCLTVNVSALDNQALLLNCSNGTFGSKDRGTARPRPAGPYYQACSR